MQNKGAIKVFAIALVLVSLYQLSFTWITNGVRKSAEEFAQGDPNKEQAFLDSLASETVYNFLWFKEFTLRECQERELNLGLDLKGGMNVTLEISVVDLIRALSNYNEDATFNEALKLALEKQKDSQEDFIDLFYESIQEIDPNVKLAAIFATIELKEKINYESTNEEVLAVIRTESESAIENSFNILRSRIDHFGVTQPNIQRLEGRNSRILVELPGVKEPERVRKLLQGTANLEFWETYDNTEIFGSLRAVNDKLRVIFEADAAGNSLTTDSTANNADSTIVAENTTVENPVADTAQVANTAVAGDSANQVAEEGGLIDQLEGDSANAAEMNIEQFRKENPLFGYLSPMTSEDGNLTRGAAIGYANFKDTAKVREILAMEQIADLLPRDVRFSWGVKSLDDNGNFFQLIALKAKRGGGPVLDGDAITDARDDFGNNQATAEVDMTMNGEGAKEWARITKENVGRQIAIVLDGYVYSFPVVNDEIRGGRSQISGNFTINEAKDLANILKSGKMPAPARIIEEEIVGPTLGEESINKGMYSFIIAFGIVLIYMIFFYKGAGVVANVALIANVFFIFGILASLGAVLTLPGIAGIVLTIGMAVDANVIIFERIKEEMALGKGMKLAIKDGYNNAYSAIIDANVTTIFTGIILYVFGHGPIKGFATTLIIGILTSLFAAIFISHLILLWYVDRDKEISFYTKFTKNFLGGINFDFIGKRKPFYIISAVIILAGFISLGVRGLNQGVDFVGGRTFVVQFQEPVSTADISHMLGTTFETNPEVKTFGGSSQVKITTKYMIESTEINADSIVATKLYEGLKPQLGDVTQADFNANYIKSSQKVGPTIADDIKISAVYSIIFALLLIFVYIFIRFKTWQFGFGAIVSLLHDSLIVIGVFSLFNGILPFSLEIDQAFIAAILTVVGYSINDTVIVFDRIREYLNNGMKGTHAELYNKAMNSTLSRTFNTSMTTLVVLFAIFLFGGEVIRGFVFALIVGIGVGTYSSVFIATPIVFDTEKKVEKIEENKMEERRKRRMRKQSATDTAVTE